MFLLVALSVALLPYELYGPSESQMPHQEVKKIIYDLVQNEVHDYNVPYITVASLYKKELSSPLGAYSPKNKSFCFIMVNSEKGYWHLWGHVGIQASSYQGLEKSKPIIKAAALHEVGHCIYEQLSENKQKEFENILRSSFPHKEINPILANEVFADLFVVDSISNHTKDFSGQKWAQIREDFSQYAAPTHLTHSFLKSKNNDKALLFIKEVAKKSK